MRKTGFISSFMDAVGDVGSTWRLESMASKMNYYGLKSLSWRKGLLNLKYRGLIEMVGKGYRFTSSGKKWFEKNASWYFHMKAPKWDKKWRVVMFDIPQRSVKARNRFRYKLKNLGFYMLQKSVFVSPYPCEKELRSVCTELKISEYFEIFVTKEIGSKEPEVREHFNIDIDA